MAAKSKDKGAEDEPFMTIGLAAEELQVSKATLRNWDRQGKLRTHRHPINGYRLYRAAEIKALKNAIRGTQK